MRTRLETRICVIRERWVLAQFICDSLAQKTYSESLLLHMNVTARRRNDCSRKTVAAHVIHHHLGGKNSTALAHSTCCTHAI